MNKLETTLNLITPIVGIVLAFILVSFSYSVYGYIGYPDGHLTEFSKFQKTVLLPIFFLVNGLFFIIFICGLAKRKHLKKINWSLAFYLLFLVLHNIITNYFYANLEHGQGG